MSSLDPFSFTSSSLESDRGRFTSPFTDLAMQYAPRTFADALKLCKHLYLNNSTYKAASEGVVSYFLTKANLTGQADPEIKKMDVSLKKFGVMARLKEMGEDRMCYGNSYASIIPPIRRFLKCAVCKSTAIPIEKIACDFRFTDLSFHARCPHCARVTRHMVKDFADRDPSRIKLTRWDPERIVIEFNEITHDVNYWMDIDAYTKSRIKEGDKFYLATTPWSFIQAIHRDQRYKFNKDYFYHMKESCIAGVQLRGWGLPSILSSFKNFFRLQILLRYDETLMMDYIVPMRIISPAATSVGQGGNSMMQTADMARFREQFQEGVVRHRLDGADWNFFPFAVNYQPIGGEGKALNQADAIRNEEDRLLNARGFPPELYRGTLTIQAAAIGLRLFERRWQPFVDELNGALQWMTDTISSLTKVGQVDAELDSITVADDAIRQQIRLQLMSAQQISKDTALAPLGIDAKSEQEKILEESQDSQRKQQKAQTDLEMEQLSLGSQEGEAAGTGGAGEATPMDIQAQGEEIAGQLADPNMTYAQRRQELSKIQQSNPTLHAVVTKALEKIRNQAGMQGRDAVLAQQAAPVQAPA